MSEIDLASATAADGGEPLLPLLAPSRRGKPPQHWPISPPEARKEAVVAAGLPAFRAKQLSKHWFERLTDDPDEWTDLPAAQREALHAQLFPPLLTSVREQTADKGGTTVKTLWRLFDGALVESVLMRYPGRVTMCVSSQAGCGMNCPFCATGQGGLQRSMSSPRAASPGSRTPVWVGRCRSR